MDIANKQVDANAKPFLKWAGGKGQLLNVIDSILPVELTNGSIEKYFEPFIGGGAVFFHLAQKFHFEEIYISDINRELIIAYKVIKKNVEPLIDALNNTEIEYLNLSSDERKEYYYKIRYVFNHNMSEINFDSFHSSWIERTAQLVFLNRTCFNGLFRVNKKGEFNVPYGKYKNPKICDKKNLLKVSNLLEFTTIKRGDFSIFTNIIDENSFVYFDPPYRPLNTSSSFTSYSMFFFDDAAQLRLADYYGLLDKKGAKIVLSNSDPKNINKEDHFFDNAYRGFNIKSVEASRNINSKGNKRGKISELLITNY